MRGPGLAATLVALVSLPAAAETHVVGPRGDDRGPGTAARPWRTLQHAADRVQPGDTVVVLPGAYVGFNLTRSGAPDRPIVFSGRPGARIDRAAAGAHRSRINVEDASHIAIEGFEIVGTNDQAESKEGIRIAGRPDGSTGHIAIRRNHIHHNGDRNILTVFASHLTIEYNVTHNAAQEHGIYVSNSADHHVIRGNVVYANAACGIQVNADASAGGDGVITDVTIEDNLIAWNGGGNWVVMGAPPSPTTLRDQALGRTSAPGAGPVRSPGGGSAINLDGVQASVIRRNVLVGNHASGISLYRIDGGQPAHDNLVEGNLIVNAADARWALNIQDGSSRNRARTNLLFSRNPERGAINIDGASLVGLDSDGNLVEDLFAVDDAPLDLAAWRKRTGADRRSLTLALPRLYPPLTRHGAAARERRERRRPHRSPRSGAGSCRARWPPSSPA